MWELSIALRKRCLRSECAWPNSIIQGLQENVKQELLVLSYFHNYVSMRAYVCPCRRQTMLSYAKLLPKKLSPQHWLHTTRTNDQPTRGFSSVIGRNLKLKLSATTTACRMSCLLSASDFPPRFFPLIAQLEQDWNELLSALLLDSFDWMQL